MHCCDILANLFEDDVDLEQMLIASGGCSDPELLASASETLMALKAQAALEASRLHKHRALVPAPTQGMIVRTNKLRRVLAPDVTFTTAWLQKAGAIKRRGASPGVSRKEIEQQEVARWRSELVAILQQAELPVFTQASLASNPGFAVPSALGSARASTIRKHVREYRKLRAYCLATSRSVWWVFFWTICVSRRLEPCARTVPAAILSCLSFVEKAGGVPATDRVSDMQMVKNTVNQCTAELETGAEPKRQAPMLPVAGIAGC